MKKRYVHSFYLYFLIASSSSSITNSMDYQHIIAVSYRYFLKLDCRNISFDKYASNWIARYFTYIQSKMINIPREAVTLTAFLQHILVPSDINRFKSFRHPSTPWQNTLFLHNQRLQKIFEKFARSCHSCFWSYYRSNLQHVSRGQKPTIRPQLCSSSLIKHAF